MTLHSWGAIAPSVDNTDKLISYIKTARSALLRWKRTQILIIDEGMPFRWASRTEPLLRLFGQIVSMIDGRLFEKICFIAARLRTKTDRPFGGIQVSPVLVIVSVIGDNVVQLVVTGDFFQLPPVTKGGEQPFFAFECDAWKACIEHTVMLTQVFRQKDDSAYFHPGLGRRHGLSIRRVRSTTE